jgi:hypothetical protein
MPEMTSGTLISGMMARVLCPQSVAGSLCGFPASDEQ